MRLAPIAQNIVMRSYMMSLLENISGDASAIQKQVVSLANELKADGEDITDDEVQAAMLSALITADGKIDQVDVSDIESIKTEIKESRGYLTEEGGILHGIELVGTVLGNAALIHLMAGGFKKVGINMDESKFKKNIESAVALIKRVTGFPAKMMEKAFTWIAKKLGFGAMGQKIAGLAGTLIVTVAFLALAIYLFPSITSGIALMFAISGMIGKSLEIKKILGEIWEHILANADEYKAQHVAN